MEYMCLTNGHGYVQFVIIPSCPRSWLVLQQNKTTGVTSGAGTVYPYDFTPGFF